MQTSCPMRMPDNQDYDDLYGTWNVDGKPIPVASTYRIAWRAMAATTGFRTFYPALIPPGAKHIFGIHSAGPIETITDVFAGAVASTLLADFYVRSSGMANLHGPAFESLPLPGNSKLYNDVAEIFLRLNCLTPEYKDLWEHITGSKWKPSIPIYNALQRQRAQVRIDVSVALLLNASEDDLRVIYRTQFPVMRKYDLEDKFDKNGRLVPKKVLKLCENEGTEKESLTWAHPQSGREYNFQPPFESFDREAEIGKVYAELLDKI